MDSFPALPTFRLGTLAHPPSFVNAGRDNFQGCFILEGAIKRRDRKDERRNPRSEQRKSRPLFRTSVFHLDFRLSNPVFSPWDMRMEPP